MFNSSHYINSTSPTGLHLPLWYQYPLCAEAPYGFIFYYGVKMFNLVVGAPCNFLVIWQIATKKNDTSTSDIFIFNLAVLDAYFCLMAPVEIVNHLLLDDSRIWYFQRFAYGVKDLAVLFLVSSAFTVLKGFSSLPVLPPLLAVMLPSHASETTLSITKSLNHKCTNHFLKAVGSDLCTKLKFYIRICTRSAFNRFLIGSLQMTGEYLRFLGI